jgi:hypothetical protein
MRIDAARPVNAEDQRVLAALLSSPFHGVDELRDQARHAMVVGRCDCGCPTVELRVPLETPASPAGTRNRLAPVEGRVTSEAGEPVGNILVFVDDGRLSCLELVWYTNEPPKAWPPSAQIRVERTDTAQRTNLPGSSRQIISSGASQ